MGKASLVVRLLTPTAPRLGHPPSFESWSFVSSKRAERISSFFSSSTRSLFWCIVTAPHELTVEVHLRDGGVVFNALPELAVVQNVVGQVVMDSMELQDLHHGLAEAAMSCSGVPLRKTSTLSFFTNVSRCSNELLPPKLTTCTPGALQAIIHAVPPEKQRSAWLCFHPHMWARALNCPTHTFKATVICDLKQLILV